MHVNKCEVENMIYKMCWQFHIYHYSYRNRVHYYFNSL